LILDEPTSSVDTVTEASILTATEELMQKRTTFMIAHRLDTLRSCDTILVLERGKLVEVKTLKDKMADQERNSSGLHESNLSFGIVAGDPTQVQHP